MAPFRGRGGFRGGRGAPRGGARGSSRGGSRGGTRGGFRGASRGDGRGRGRGGGGHTSRGDRPGFTTARVDNAGAEGRSETPESLPQDVESDLSEGLSDDEAEDAKPASSAFHTLLQSFQQSKASHDNPRRKRRKLDHAPMTVEEEGSVCEEADSAEESEVRDAQVEEGPEVADADDLDNGEDLEDETDPFESHFANPSENELSQRLKDISEGRWSRYIVQLKGGKCSVQVPTTADTASRRKVRGLQDVKLKLRLVENAHRVLGNFSDAEQIFASSLFDYQDILYCARTVQNAGRLRHLACLHALNHIFKTRDRVVKNNAKLAKEQEETESEYRDQGFTRPKVLFLLETKQACVRAVDCITQLCDFEQQENKKRFMDSFSAPEDTFSPDKPADFRELFEGNDENEFRVGLKFTRKTMKLYSKFYNSDIIFASPLGLRRAIETGDPKKKDSDFLSSIELVVMEQADATLMQNWEHAEYVFEHVNLQPKEAHGCDFSRVRTWYLDGHAAHMRQMIVLSAYLMPTFNTLWNKHMQGIAGRMKATIDYTDGMIETLNYGIKQTFSRFDSPSHIKDPDARFKFFNTAILPQITRLPKPVEGGLGVLVFIPSYLDFVRIRNSLVDSDFSFASVSEYTDATNVRKARSHFMNGKHSLLLYTGRAHHFHRYQIRGVKRVVFYGVPENPLFYEEVVGFIGKTVERGECSKAETSVRVCFSKWEFLELERVVGSKRVWRLANDKGDVFDFV